MISSMIRFHPSQDYYEDVDGEFKKLGNYCAMISFIMAPDGSCQDIHRTYLTKDGEKAPVANVKKTLASIEVKGGAIRLSSPTGNVLAVAEGIESAYAVEIFKNLPCWSLVNTSGMKNFIVPEGIKYLHIFADNDKPNKFKVRAGFDAACKLRDRVEKSGVIVTLHSPTKVGTDILDLLCGIQQ
jgi:putative DNA primase/helicase